MKKIILTTLVCLCIMTLVACTSKDKENNQTSNTNESNNSPITELVSQTTTDSKDDNIETKFEKNFSAEFKDKNYIFSFKYPKELEISENQGYVAVLSTDPIISLVFMNIKDSAAKFDEYKNELTSSYSDFKEFSVNNKKAIKGIQYVGQGAKINYVIDTVNKGIIVVQGTFDGSGSDKYIDMLDKIVDSMVIN